MIITDENNQIPKKFVPDNGRKYQNTSKINYDRRRKDDKIKRGDKRSSNYEDRRLDDRRDDRRDSMRRQKRREHSKHSHHSR